MKKGKLLLLSASLITMCLSACQSNSSKPEEKPVEDNVPETGKADRSSLKYASSLDSYKKSDWKGHWIWTNYCYEDSYVAFRKVFNLKEKVNEATAYISAESKYFMWVNEELVTIDGSLKRGPTPYDSYYDEVKISNLKEGNNIITILVAFNGRSGDSSINPQIEDEEGDMVSQAGLLFEMQAGDTLVKSDSSFKTIRIDAYRNKITGGKEYDAYTQSSMLAERNVFYDARKEIGDYKKLEFDDSSWESAKAVAKAGNLPFGDLYKAPTKPIKFHEIADFSNANEYVGKTLKEDTTLALSLPTDIQFSWYIDIEAEAGKKLVFYTDSYKYNDGLQSFKDTYVTKDGQQSYENYPWRSGYTLFIDAPAGIKFNKLAYRMSEFNGELMSPFTSSDSNLDILWKVGWVKNDNAIPSRAPSVKPQEIPNQSLAFLTSAYHYFEHTNDVETMTLYVKAAIEYLKLYEMENGLPKYRAGSWTWNDWGSCIDNNLLQVGFYYYALRLTKELVSALKMNDDISFVDERMASMESKYHDAYYTENGFKSSSSNYIDDRANAMLALSGLAKESDYETIINVLTKTREASPFCEKYVLEALCKMGRIDLAKERMLLRYDAMIKDSKDTLYEKFDITDGTFNHAWTSGPIYIINRYIAGLKPTKPGFEEYSLSLTNLLDSFKCSNYTVKGNIDIELTSKDGVKALTIKSIDSKGEIIIPSSLGNNVSVSGGSYDIKEGNSSKIVTISEAKTYTITIK